MKSIYSSLVALVVFVVFASLAIADPGTTWDNQIDGKKRFRVLNDFDGSAVFDRETGRVCTPLPVVFFRRKITKARPKPEPLYPSYALNSLFSVAVAYLCYLDRGVVSQLQRLQPRFQHSNPRLLLF
jgi:hypothetical protein